MKTGTFNLPIAFTTDEYAETPSTVVVEIDKSTIAQIEKSFEIMKENSWMKSIRIDFQASDFLDENEETHDFEADGQQLIVYPDGGIFFYAQNANYATVQIETASFAPLLSKTKKK